MTFYAEDFFKRDIPPPSRSTRGQGIKGLGGGDINAVRLTTTPLTPSWEEGELGQEQY
jgi:hypothetical protein